MRDRVEEMLERVAEAVKDALLDWEMDEDGTNGQPGLYELPPLEPAVFVETLRAKMEDVLWRMAEAVNEAPTGRILAASEESVRSLLTDLYREALELGLQMRLDAAEAALPPTRRPHGSWARRWRHMQAGGCPVTLSRLPKLHEDDSL
jgi:hypothetical protein